MIMVEKLIAEIKFYFLSEVFQFMKTVVWKSFIRKLQFCWKNEISAVLVVLYCLILHGIMLVQLCGCLLTLQTFRHCEIQIYKGLQGLI